MMKNFAKVSLPLDIENKSHQKLFVELGEGKARIKFFLNFKEPKAEWYKVSNLLTQVQHMNNIVFNNHNSLFAKMNNISYNLN